MPLHPGWPERKYQASACHECRLSQWFYRYLNKTWDWACALRKETIMHIRHIGEYDLWNSRVEPRTLRGIYEFQRGRCAVTSLPLRVPDALTPIPTNTTLTSWADSQRLSDCQRAELPLLVRAGAVTEWTPGNVVLIARVVREPYAYCKTLVRTCMFFGNQRSPVIPTVDDVVAHSTVLEKRLFVELKSRFMQQLKEEADEPDVEVK